MLDDKSRQFYRPTKSADFCTTNDRFLLADLIGRQQHRPIFVNRVSCPLVGHLAA